MQKMRISTSMPKKLNIVMKSVKDIVYLPVTRTIPNDKFCQFGLPFISFTPSHLYSSSNRLLGMS
jgi:hypothetical protein